MRNKIISVIALLLGMFAITGIATANPYNAGLVDHSGVNAPQDIYVYPGEMFHLHFKMDTMSASTKNNPIDYNPANGIVALAPPKIGSPSQITLTITDPLSAATGLPTFTPNSDPYTDYGAGGASGPHPNRINIAVASDAPAGASYAINIPTQSEVSGENGTASRTIHVISPNTTLTKTVTSQSSPFAPSTVTYTINEMNTGNVLLDDTIIDSGLPPGATCTPPLPYHVQLAPLQSVTVTCTVTYNSAGTFTNTATATAHPIVFVPGVGNVTTNITVNESASATVNVTTIGKPGKFKAWGKTPDKDFEIWVFSQFMPQGKVSVHDHAANLDIETISISSVTTTATTGQAKGIAHVTSTGGVPPPGVPGDHAFIVNVDATTSPSAPRGTIEIIVPDLMYDNKEPLSFGVIGILK